MSSNSAPEDPDESDLAHQATLLRSTLRGFFARRGIVQDDVEDAVQDVFLRAARQERLGEMENVGAFLMRIAASVLIDRHRRRKSHFVDRHIAFDPERHAGTVPASEEISCAREALRQTSLVLMELPERTRTVFVLNRLENMPNREIALRLGISVSAVEKHMGRATRHLMARAGEIR